GAVDDGSVAARQRVPEGIESPAQERTELGGLDRGLGPLAAAHPVEAGVAVFVARAERRVERQVAAPQPLLHLDDLVLIHLQPLGQKAGGGREALALELVLLGLEVEEQPPLGLRGAELDRSKIVDDELED